MLNAKCPAFCWIPIRRDKILNSVVCILLGCAHPESFRDTPESRIQYPESSIQDVSVLVPENQKYRDILAEELKGMTERNETFLLIDVRTPKEYATGYIEKAINIQYTEIKNKSRTFG